MVQDQVDAYRRESDSVAMFIEEEGYSPAIDDFVFLKALYGDYKTFCCDNGYKTCSIRTFSERIKMIGFLTERKTPGNVVYAKK